MSPLSTRPLLPDSLSLTDRDVIAGVLEVLVVLWEGVRQRLGTPKHKILRSKLESTVAESLPLLFNALTVSSGPPCISL